MVDFNLNVGQVMALYRSGQLGHEEFKSTLGEFSKDELLDHMIGEFSSQEDDSDDIDEIDIPGDEDE